MTLRVFVVDDERLAVRRLTRLLNETGRVEIAGSATDPEAALAFLQANPIDLLFLDVQMPGLTGFELLGRLARDVPVVFTTAFDQYALAAFDVHSIDYLLKPIAPERLARALDRAERIGAAAPDVRRLARELALQLAPGRGAARLERLASRVGERTTILDVPRISHFFAKDKLTFAVVSGRAHIVDATLGELEQRLDAKRFVRVHRAAIVNVSFVRELYPGVDGMLVRLTDERGTELAVARDRVRDLKTRLGI